MKALKITAGCIAIIPSLILYVLGYALASMVNAAREGWRDGR